MKIILAFLERFVGLSGGIEHVCCNMANEFAHRGHSVSIAYCYGENSRPFYPLDKDVKLYNLMTLSGKKWRGKHLGENITSKDKIMREMIRVFSKSKGREWNEAVKARMIVPQIQEIEKKEKPDIIISFRYETSNYLLNYAKVKTPVITMFHIDPDNALPAAPEGEITAIEKSARAQVLLKGDIDKVRKYCPGANLVWIPNVVPQYGEQADLSQKKKNYTIIDVARLNKDQKRQHLLIQAFNKLAKDFPAWNVELWGQMDEHNKGYTESLKKMISDFHLEDRVFIKGQNNHIIDVYLHSDIFAFPSAYEGFPLSMTEAMSAGLPIAAYKSCESAAELIKDGETGIIVSDGAEGMAEALKKLMENRDLRVRLGNAARKDMQQFKAEKIWNQWENLMQEVIAEKR